MLIILRSCIRVLGVPKTMVDRIYSTVSWAVCNKFILLHLQLDYSTQIEVLCYRRASSSLEIEQALAQFDLRK